MEIFSIFHAFVIMYQAQYNSDFVPSILTVIKSDKISNVLICAKIAHKVCKELVPKRISASILRKNIIFECFQNDR